jgi:hypothetical protein
MSGSRARPMMILLGMIRQLAAQLPSQRLAALGCILLPRGRALRTQLRLTPQKHVTQIGQPFRENS